MEEAGEHKVKIWAFYPLLIVPGLIHVFAPSAVNSIMKQLELQESQGGLLQFVYFSGAFFGIILITFFLQRFSAKQIVLTMVGVLSASLLACAAAPYYSLLLLAFVVSGFSNGILITLPGTYVTATCGERSPQIQTMLFGFFSLGLVLGPLLPGLAVRWDISWRWATIIPAIVIIPLTVPFALSKLEDMGEVDRLSAKMIRNVLSFNRSLFLGLFFALLLYAAAQSSINTWMVRFLENQKGMTPGSAHWVLMGTAFMVTIGRWICSFASRKIDPFKILFFICSVGAVMVLIAPLTESALWSLVCYPILGLFFSGVTPFLVGYAAWFPESESSGVFTLFIAAGTIGGAVFPYLTGLVNQHINPYVGMSSIVILVIGILFCLYWIKPHIISAGRDEGTQLEDAA